MYYRSLRVLIKCQANVERIMLGRMLSANNIRNQNISFCGFIDNDSCNFSAYERAIYIISNNNISLDVNSYSSSLSKNIMPFKECMLSH